MTPRREVHARIHGLYGIADGPELAEAMLEGGCRLIQLRKKGLARADLCALGIAVRDLCRAHGATFILNDDPWVAAFVDADGVHLGPGDPTLEHARVLVGADRIVGMSTDTPEDAALCEADYVAFGPIFATSNLSRPKAVQGVSVLADVRRVVDAPLVAIGGIDAGNVRWVVDAGADAWAVIGAIAGADDPVAATRALVR